MNRIYDYISPLFLMAIIGFFVVLGLGYFSTFASVLPDWPRPVIVLITIGWLALIWLTIKHAAAQLVRVLSERGKGWLLFCVFYFALFIFSGVGFITTFMFLYEGPVIVREKTAQLSNAVVQMSTRAQADLPVPAYRELVARTVQNRGSLLREIDNPSGGAFCGIGSSARSVISNLQRDFPQFPIIRGSDIPFNCADVTRVRQVSAAYADAIDTALRTHPILTQSRVSEREQLLRDIQLMSNQQLPRLQGLDRQLSGVASFVSNADLYRVALSTLTDANSAYAALYPRLAQFSPQTQSTLPQRIDLTEAQSVSSGFEVINAILTRMYRPTVWGILLAAFIIDFIMVAMVALMIWRLKTQVEARLVLERSRSIEGTGVDYIWMPPVRSADGRRNE